jgi:hypothetical protein
LRASARARQSVEQQGVLQLHLLREQYKSTRNARLNLLRAAFRELGILIPRGLRSGMPALHAAVHEASSELPARATYARGQALDGNIECGGNVKRQQLGEHQPPHYGNA